MLCFVPASWRTSSEPLVGRRHVFVYRIRSAYYQYAQSRDMTDELRQRQSRKLGGTTQRQALVLVERRRQRPQAEGARCLCRPSRTDVSGLIEDEAARHTAVRS